jgi:phage terminase small subunit
MSKRNKTDPDQWKGGVIIRNDGDAPALNERQEKFVDEYVRNGGNGLAAAKAAGFDGNGGNLIADHRIRVAIEQKRDTEIKTQGASEAWRVMQSLLSDPAAPAQVRFQAARWTLEASGHGLSAIAAAIHMGQKGKKDPGEMTVSELTEIVERGRKQLESMKQVVNEMKSVEDAIEIKPNSSQP